MDNKLDINKDDMKEFLNKVYGFIMDSENTIDDLKYIEKDINHIQKVLNLEDISSPGWTTSFSYNHNLLKMKKMVEETLTSILYYKKIETEKDMEKLNIILNMNNFFVTDIKTINACIVHNSNLLEKIMEKIPNNNWDVKRKEKIIKISPFVIYQNDLAIFLIKNKPEKMSYFFDIPQRQKTNHKKYHEYLNAQYEIWGLALNHNPEAITILVNQGFDINACKVLTHSNEITPKREYNILSLALKHFSNEKIQTIMDNNFLYREDEWEEKTPFDYIFYGKWNKLCQTLYDNGIKPNKDWINKKITENNNDIKNIIQNIPISLKNLKHAAQTNPLIIPLILKNNPNILKDKEADTQAVLSSIIIGKNIDNKMKEKLFWLLIEHGATVNHNKSDEEQKTHLIEKLAFNPITDEIFDYVLKHSKEFLLDKQKTEDFSLNLFIYNPKYLEKMLNEGFDPNIINSEKRTPLMDAVGGIQFDNKILDKENVLKFKESSNILLKYNANVNIRNKVRETAIFECQDPEILIKLIEKGAKYNIKNRHKQTLSEAFKNKGYQEIDATLQQYILNKKIGLQEKPKRKRPTL